MTEIIESPHLSAFLGCLDNHTVLRFVCLWQASCGYADLGL